MNVFEEWTCIFPGKHGLSWKQAWYGSGPREEAENQASKNCNVVAVPLQLFQHIKEIEHRMVAAETKLQDLGIRMDYVEGKPVFISLSKASGQVSQDDF